MGVDAKMIVKTPYWYSPEELRQWSYIFGSAFHDYLMIGHDEKVYNKPLTDEFESYEVDEFQQDFDNKIKVIKVPLSGRYYGPGYERGPLMIYIVMAEFLEKLIPDSSIYYYGDSGGYSSAKLFDYRKRNELMDYYIKNRGKDNYNRYFDRDNIGENCPVCEIKMIQNGWGAKYKLFTCLGCGWMHKEKDGVIEKGFDIKGF